MRNTIILVNANRMRPPVAPLALDYVGGRLAADGFDVRVVDLAFADGAGAALSAALTAVDPLAVGVTFRNTDDCFWPSAACFVPQLHDLVAMARSMTAAPVVLGGCGYSIFPLPVLQAVGAEFGVVGDAEGTFLHMARALRKGEPVGELPGVVHGQTINPPLYAPGDLHVPTRRDLIDNARYFREGAMGNVETKRGCPMPCIYCADPVARGHAVRCRPPADVADEIEALLRQGVDVLHLCDGEFNIPPAHAMAVCEELIRRKLGERVRWYCYATVHPFTQPLAHAMRRAGCVGINFGADSACDAMLATLARGYRREAIADAVTYCRRAGITVMLDLLLGGPGETPETVAETISFVKRVDPDRCGAATGIRLYPGTPMAERVRKQGPFTSNPHLHGQLEDNDDLLQPIFYIDRSLGEDAGALVCDLIGNDQRFFPPPRLQGMDNYNYNDNTALIEAIREGHRGAFWDILRRLADNID